MLLLVFAKDNDVIHHAKYPLETFQKGAHPLLEVLWGTSNGKWQLVVTVMPEWHDKCCKYSFDSSDRGICQKPEFASSLLKFVAPVSWANLSSTLGNR